MLFKFFDFVFFFNQFINKYFKIYFDLLVIKYYTNTIFFQIILEYSNHNEYSICLLFTGPRYAVQIGEKMIDYNEEFRLFLSTRNPNPFIPPDASSIVTEVNFTTTASGLRGQVGI